MKQLDVGAARPVRIETSVGAVAALTCGTGHPVLLVPGFTGSKEDFGPLLDPIAGAGFRAVAIDLPGQFESAPGAPDDPSAYSPGALATAVCDVAAALSEPVHLLGHSFGGLVVRAAVLAGCTVRSLVLMGSGPAALGGVRADRIELMRPLLQEVGVAGVYEASEALAASEPGYVPDPPELAAFLRRRFLAGPDAMLLGMGTALLDEPDRTGELAALRLPVLVLFGTDDDAWPPALQRRMAERLGAAVSEIDGAAHSPAVENPADTATALIDFWRRVR